jgi:hypothetical protein
VVRRTLLTSRTAAASRPVASPAPRFATEHAPRSCRCRRPGRPHAIIQSWTLRTLDGRGLAVHSHWAFFQLLLTRCDARYGSLIAALSVEKWPRLRTPVRRLLLSWISGVRGQSGNGAVHVLNNLVGCSCGVQYWVTPRPFLTICGLSCFRCLEARQPDPRLWLDWPTMWEKTGELRPPRHRLSWLSERHRLHALSPNRSIPGGRAFWPARPIFCVLTREEAVYAAIITCHTSCYEETIERDRLLDRNE